AVCADPTERQASPQQRNQNYKCQEPRIFTHHPRRWDRRHREGDDVGARAVLQLNGAQREHDIELPERLDCAVSAAAVAEPANRVLRWNKVEIWVQLPDLAAEKLQAPIARYQLVANSDDIGCSIKEPVPDVLAMYGPKVLVAEHLGEIRQGA